MNKLFLDGSKLLYHPDALNRWKKGTLFVPVHLEISPSGGCNQRCLLCCVDYLGHKARFLSEEKLLSIVKEAKEGGVKSVLLAGEGEPTLNPGIVEMIRCAKQIGLDFALNTNGVFLNPEMSKEILPGLQWLRFSMQASHSSLYEKIHGVSSNDFSKVTNNIREAVRIKNDLNLSVALGIQQILLPENAGDIFAMASLAKELGVDYYVVKRFSKHPQNTYDVDEGLYLGLEDEFKRVEGLGDDRFRVIVRWKNFIEDCHRKYDHCTGIGFIAHILSDGSVYPCSQYFYKKEYCYGNVHEASLSEIFNSATAKNVKNKIISETDVSQCMTYCRHHGTNQFLAELLNEPQHVEFI